MSQREEGWDIRYGAPAQPPGYSLSQMNPNVTVPCGGFPFRGVMPSRIAQNPRGIAPTTNVPSWSSVSAPRQVPIMATELSYSTAPVQDPWSMRPIDTKPVGAKCA